MATLADSFLQDLEDLEDDDDDLHDGNTTDQFGVGGRQQNHFLSSEDGEDDESIPDAVALYEKAQVETVSIVSNLSQQQSFLDTLAEVRLYAEKEPKLITTTTTTNLTTTADGQSSTNNNSNGTTMTSNHSLGLTEGGALDSHEYALIEKSNQMIAKLDVEILNIHSFIRDVYSKKFPELDSIVFSPLEYIAVVQRIKNETDLTVVELTDILPSTVTMAVTVAASMTTGQPLPSADLDKVLKAAGEAMYLADCRKDVLGFLESRMGVLAPNVSSIIGSALAARLITHAGGVTALARMPAQNIMLIGSAGLAPPGSVGGGSQSTSSTSATRSLIYGCEIVQSTPQGYRNRALKLVSGKLGLAARVDSFRESLTGQVGRALRDKIVESLVKAQEPPPAPLKKALPIPDDAPKSRRGGKRYRRSKEKYGLSEFQKQANRLAFGPEAEDEIGQETEGGFGMINKGFGHGRLRLQAKQQKVQVKRQKRQQRQITAGSSSLSTTSATGVAGSSGATGGMSSSLAFTPLQGIEFYNPEAFIKQTPLKEDKDYFSSAVTFIKPEVPNM